MIKKIKKYKWIVLVFVLLIVLIPISFFSYKIYKDKQPVATKDVVTTENKVESSKDGYKKLVEQVNDNKDKDRGFKYLFESKITPLDSNKTELSGSENFQRNMMNLIQSGHPSDINQAAALWTKNQENYNFTTDDNIINAGIGHDVLIYNKYFELVDGLEINAIGSFQSNMGRSIKERFQTPMTMALIGAQLMPQGQEKFLVDYDSNIVDYAYTGLEYVKMTQYKKESDYEKSDNKEKLQKIFEDSKNLNSIYEVEINNKYNRESTAYITEDTSGNLAFYGIYYKSPMNNDSTLADYKKQIAEYGEYDGATQNDITWSNFVDATK